MLTRLLRGLTPPANPDPIGDLCAAIRSRPHEWQPWEKGRCTGIRHTASGVTVGKVDYHAPNVQRPVFVDVSAIDGHRLDLAILAWSVAALSLTKLEPAHADPARDEGPVSEGLAGGPRPHPGEGRQPLRVVWGDEPDDRVPPAERGPDRS